MSGKERCDPTVTPRVTSAALSDSDSASTRNVTPRPTAAAAVIRASCPPPTIPTTGIPVPDLRTMGPAGPAGDNGESTPCSLRGTTNTGYNQRGENEAAASRSSPPSPPAPPASAGRFSSGRQPGQCLPAGSTHDNR